jgi:hypothetical protein
MSSDPNTQNAVSRFMAAFGPVTPAVYAPYDASLEERRVPQGRFDTFISRVASAILGDADPNPAAATLPAPKLPWGPILATATVGLLAWLFLHE